MGGFLQRLLLLGTGWLFWRWWKKPSRSKDTDKPYIDWTDERKFQWFLNRRTGYSTGARESYSRYDQTIAAFSAGTIVLSITFLKEIGYTAWSIPFLYSAWSAFVIAVWYGLLSLRTSADYDLEQITQLENLCMGRQRDMKRAEELGVEISKCNKIAVRSFMAGIILSVIFAFVNFPLLGGKKWQAEKEAPKAAPQRVEVVVVAPPPKPEQKSQQKPEQEPEPKLEQKPGPAPPPKLPPAASDTKPSSATGAARTNTSRVVTPVNASTNRSTDRNRKSEERHGN